MVVWTVGSLTLQSHVVVCGSEVLPQRLDNLQERCRAVVDTCLISSVPSSREACAVRALSRGRQVLPHAGNELTIHELLRGGEVRSGDLGANEASDVHIEGMTGGDYPERWG